MSSGPKTTTHSHIILSQEDFLKNFIFPLVNHLSIIYGINGSQNVSGEETVLDGLVDNAKVEELFAEETTWAALPVADWVALTSDPNILEEAQDLVYGDRGTDYGHPLDDYTRTAQMISAILGVPVDYKQAIMIMMAVKISRQVNQPKRDNLVDLAGYALCLDRAIRKEEERNE